MTMRNDNKPGYPEFIKYHAGFKYSDYITGRDLNKYVERSKTKILANLSYIIMITIMVIVTSCFRRYSHLHWAYKALFLILGVSTLSFILETIHWLYAEFDLLKEEKDDNKV